MGYIIARMIIIISIVLVVCAIFAPVKYQDRICKLCLWYARFIAGLCLFSILILTIRSQLGTLILITIIGAFCVYIAIEGDD